MVQTPNLIGRAELRAGGLPGLRAQAVAGTGDLEGPLGSKPAGDLPFSEWSALDWGRGDIAARNKHRCAMANSFSPRLHNRPLQWCVPAGGIAVWFRLRPVHVGALHHPLERSPQASQARHWLLGPEQL